ncbi:MAG TPA: hypothetical protein VMV95_00965 [Bacillota bacterium]|nr:hypothetical protein [Bacillota bacterium]
MAKETTTELTPENGKELARLKRKEERRKARLRKNYKEKIANFFYDISMYVATAGGVMFSKYLPIFKEVIQNDLKEIAILTPYKLQIIASLGLAFVVVYMDEKGGDVIGKKRNWKKRVFNHVARGVMWHTIIGG